MYWQQGDYLGLERKRAQSIVHMMLCTPEWLYVAPREGLMMGSIVAVSGTLSAAQSKHACFAMPCVSWSALLSSGLRRQTSTLQSPKSAY